MNTHRYSKVFIQDIKRDFAHPRYLDTPEEGMNEEQKDENRNEPEINENPGVNEDPALGARDQSIRPEEPDINGQKWEDLTKNLRGGQGPVVTRAGRRIRPPDRFGHAN